MALGTTIPANEISYRAPQTPVNYAEAAVVNDEPLKVMARGVALEYGIDEEKLFNIIEAESDWNPDAVGDNGHARGLLQIHDKYWPEITDEQAFDPLWSMRFFAQMDLDGKDHYWTPCACGSHLRVKGINFPRGWWAGDFYPNTEAFIGSVAVFQYNLPHVAYVVDMDETGFWVSEANYEPCKVGTRFIKWNDPKLVGFWTGQ